MTETTEPAWEGELVWTAMLDDQYLIKVVRTKPYEGVLSISKDGDILHSQPTRLAFDARFGPDVSDVADWQDIAIKVVDAL